MLLNTICLLVKKAPRSVQIADVLRARKKTGFGVGNVFGVVCTVEAV
jgi:hypothetical protein